MAQVGPGSWQPSTQSHYSLSGKAQAHPVTRASPVCTRGHEFGCLPQIWPPSYSRAAAGAAGAAAGAAVHGPLWPEVSVVAIRSWAPEAGSSLCSRVKTERGPSIRWVLSSNFPPCAWTAGWEPCWHPQGSSTVCLKGTT